MAFLLVKKPEALCVCGASLPIPEEVLREPEGEGRKFEVRCGCGEIWSFDSYPALIPYLKPPLRTGPSDERIDSAEEGS